MGQKVNPHGLRVGVIKDWDSRWYAREDKVGDLVVEDYNIRKYLKNKLYAAGVAKIEIERSNGKVKINLWCSRPGVVIGKAGTEKVAKETGAAGASDGSAVKKAPIRNASKKVGPNDPCPCGSGKKYKKCCMQKDKEAGME